MVNWSVKKGLFKWSLVPGVLLAATNLAWAGLPAGVGTITYAPVAQAVPTLSEWMLFLISGLVAVVAFKTLRSTNFSRPLAWLVSGGLLLLTFGPGRGVIGDAIAAVAPGMFLSSPSGGTATIPFSGADVLVTNDSGVTQTIGTIAPNPGFSLGTPGTSPQCVNGLSLSNLGTCWVRINGGLPD